LLHDFLSFEEIKENLFQINSRLKSLRFKVGSKSIYNEKKIFFAVLDASKSKKYLIKDIRVPDGILALNLEDILFNKVSSHIKIKCLIKIEYKKGNYSNPIKRINFTVERDEFNIKNNIVFDLTTDPSTTPFNLLLQALKCTNFTTI
jgi:hypothetical protein